MVKQSRYFSAKEEEMLVKEFKKHIIKKIAILNGAVTLLTSLVSSAVYRRHENNIRREKHIQEITPELNEYMKTVKLELNEKYPKLDTTDFTFRNLNSSLREAYQNCFLIERGDLLGEKVGVSIKDGWSDFYVDYGKGALNGYVQHLSLMMNDFEHISYSDCFLAVLPVIIFSGILSLTAFTLWQQSQLMRTANTPDTPEYFDFKMKKKYGDNSFIVFYDSGVLYNKRHDLQDESEEVMKREQEKNSQYARQEFLRNK